MGKNFYDLKYPDELAAKLQRQIRQVFETRRGLTDETPYTSPTGAGGHYEYIFRPVFADDGPVADDAAGPERRIIVKAALAALSEEQRQVLDLAYFEGLTQPEMAAQLAIPLGTVKTRVRDGLIKLRRLQSDQALKAPRNVGRVD